MEKYPIITGIDTSDVRFPTSLDKTGSDAMNVTCDYSAAYCILHTDNPNLVGHGMTFTIGRGNELVCAAIRHLAEPLVGAGLESLVKNMGDTWKRLVGDSQLRWLGPERGVMHLALAAVVNALWDLWAKTARKPVWRLIGDMTPEEVVRCIDFTYMTDFLTREEALDLLQKQRTSGERSKISEEVNQNRAVTAYTTSAGWLGYDDDKMRNSLGSALADGYRHFKLKVGGNMDDDRRRLSIARDVMGYGADKVLMVDANQVWSVPEAIEHMKQLSSFKPWFIEEPTSPDDILGHRDIREALKPLGIGVATGEMCQNRVMFKQLLKAGAIDVCQVDACRLGGLNEVLAVLLMAAKADVPVVCHSGGVGLPEYTSHIAIIDHLVVSGKKPLLEWVDHLHEHFEHPAEVKDGCFVTPLAPGYSVEMKKENMEKFQFPGVEGKSFWTTAEGRNIVNLPRTIHRKTG